jgi:hypothetical protein
MELARRQFVAGVAEAPVRRLVVRANQNRYAIRDETDVPLHLTPGLEVVRVYREPSAVGAGSVVDRHPHTATVDLRLPQRACELHVRAETVVLVLHRDRDVSSRDCGERLQDWSHLLKRHGAILTGRPPHHPDGDKARQGCTPDPRSRSNRVSHASLGPMPDEEALPLAGHETVPKRTHPEAVRVLLGSCRDTCCRFDRSPGKRGKRDAPSAFPCASGSRQLG